MGWFVILHYNTLETFKMCKTYTHSYTSSHFLSDTSINAHEHVTKINMYYVKNWIWTFIIISEWIPSGPAALENFSLSISNKIYFGVKYINPIQLSKVAHSSKRGIFDLWCI